jgi:hypothetical protein
MSEPSSRLPETTSRRGLVVGIVAGLPVIAYGVRGALVDAHLTRPAEFARWIVGTALVNDLVLLPAVLAAGWALRRATPARLWAPVRAGLMTTGLLCLVGWPLVQGFGRDATNPSLFPRDYGAGLARAVAVVWLAVAAWIVVTALVARRRARP